MATKKDTATFEDLELDQGAPNPATEDSTSTPGTATPAGSTENREHEVNASGFYIYIGPNIRGVIQNGTIYRGTRAEAYEKAAAAIEKFRLVKALIVSGDALPVARLKLKEGGNAFNVNYKRLSDQAKAGYEKIMKED